MGVNIGTWARMVHETYVGTTRYITAAEAVEKLGTPAGSGTAEQQLNTAVARGWFKREMRAVEIGGRTRQVAHYLAIDRWAQRGRKDSGSYFSGLVRCRSIFDLGKVL